MSITLKKVSYSYQGKYQTVRAVDDVSYDFEPGKVYAIVGKSGSGKTTLLSLMAGLDLPVEGDIIVDGRSTREWDRSRMRRDLDLQSVSAAYRAGKYSVSIEPEKASEKRGSGPCKGSQGQGRAA